MLFDWYVEKREHKTVKLTDVYLCKSVTGNDIIRHLNDLGLYQWRRLMSYIFSEAVVKAYEREEKMADITKMFSYDMVYVDEHGHHTKNQKEVCEILFKALFNTVKETNEEIIVTLRPKVYVR